MTCEWRICRERHYGIDRRHFLVLQACAGCAKQKKCFFLKVKSQKRFDTDTCRRCETWQVIHWMIISWMQRTMMIFIVMMMLLVGIINSASSIRQGRHLRMMGKYDGIKGELKETGTRLFKKSSNAAKQNFQRKLWKKEFACIRIVII